MIRFLSILLFSIASLTAAGKVTATIGTNLPPQHNFLFVVDTSGSMDSQKVLAANLVRWGIYSGFLGQAQEGDSIDIWTYDDENHITRYPPQIVGRHDPEQMALAAGRFIEGLKFRGRSLFPPVATDLNLLMPHTKGLLVMIVTDGEEPISGISVDIDINEYIAREKRERPDSRDPYLISFAVVNGQISQWTVHHGDQELQLAALPERPKPEPVLAKVEKTPAKKKKTPEPPVVIDFPPGAQIVGTVPLASELESENEASAITSLETALALHDRSNAPLVATSEPARTEANIARTAKASTPVAQAKSTRTTNVPAPQVAAKTINTAVAAAIIRQPTPSKGLTEFTSKPNSKSDPNPESKPVVAAAAVASVKPAAKPGSISPTNSTVSIASVSALKPSIPVAKTSTPASKTGGEPATYSSLGIASIPASAIYIALLAGLASLALGVVMLLRKSKARHTGSIISRSLQR